MVRPLEVGTDAGTGAAVHMGMMVVKSRIGEESPAVGMGPAMGWDRCRGYMTREVREASCVRAWIPASDMLSRHARKKNPIVMIRTWDGKFPPMHWIVEHSPVPASRAFYQRKIIRVPTPHHAPYHHGMLENSKEPSPGDQDLQLRPGAFLSPSLTLARRGGL